MGKRRRCMDGSVGDAAVAAGLTGSRCIWLGFVPISPPLSWRKVEGEVPHPDPEHEALALMSEEGVRAFSPLFSGFQLGCFCPLEAGA